MADGRRNKAKIMPYKHAIAAYGTAIVGLPFKIAMAATAPPFNNTATKMSLFWVQKLYNMLTLKQKIQKYMKIQFSILILEKSYGHRSFFSNSFRI